MVFENEQKSIQKILSPLFQHKIMRNAGLDSLSEEERTSLIHRAESLLLSKMWDDHED